MPRGAERWAGDWLSLLGVEVLAGDVDGVDLALVVHRRALPGNLPVAVKPPQVTGRPALHVPIRPLWICRNDAQPWPCAQARLDLTAGYRGLGVSLACYLAMQYVDALTELHILNPDTAPDPRALWERMIGWAVRDRP